MKDDEALKKFGKHIKQLRKSKGFTQERLSIESGLALSQIARIETGKRNPTYLTLRVLAKALKVKIGVVVDLGNLD